MIAEETLSGSRSQGHNSTVDHCLVPLRMPWYFLHLTTLQVAN